MNNSDQIADLYAGKRISLRNMAIAAGQVFYTTGKPCKRKHMSERYASTGMCVACLKEIDINRKEAVRQANIARNTALFAGLTPCTVHVNLALHPAVFDYAHVLRYGSPELVEQCKAFIALMKETVTP